MLPDKMSVEKRGCRVSRDCHPEERPERDSRLALRWLLLLLLLLTGVVTTASVVLGRPEAIISRITERAGLPPGSITVEEVRWLEGRRVALTGLSIDPDHPARPAIWIRHAVVDVPRLWGLGSGPLNLGAVELDGLAVTMQQQRPAPRQDRTFMLCAEQLTVVDASVQAREDPPLKALSALAIEGRLEEVCWQSGDTRILARGALAA